MVEKKKFTTCVLVQNSCCVQKILDLTDTQRAGDVLAALAGNHAQGLAPATKHMGVNDTIVMPRTTPAVKMDTVITVIEASTNHPKQQ